MDYWLYIIYAILKKGRLKEFNIIIMGKRQMLIIQVEEKHIMQLIEANMVEAIIKGLN